MSEQKISKETLDNLLKLSRIAFAENEREGREKKLLEDFRHILDYFSALSEVNTKNVVIVSGGKAGENEYRKDEVVEAFILEDAKAEFPDTANGYLKVPAILEHKKKK